MSSTNIAKYQHLFFANGYYLRQKKPNNCGSKNPCSSDNPFIYQKEKERK